MTTEKLYIQDGDDKREFMPEEYAQNTLDKAEADTVKAVQLAAEQSVTDAKASRDAKLAKMGFTLEEIENW
jgi:hypothetical protein